MSVNLGPSDVRNMEALCLAVVRGRNARGAQVRNYIRIPPAVCEFLKSSLLSTP